MSKAALALFVLAAVAIGLLIVLLIGALTVEEDGVEKDGAWPTFSERSRTVSSTAAG